MARGRAARRSHRAEDRRRRDRRRVLTRAESVQWRNIRRADARRLEELSMTPWQRRARLAIGISAIAFGIFVAFAFKHRADGLAPPAIQPVEQGALVVTL